MTATVLFPADWVRPWYPAGPIGHTRADCPELLRLVADPKPGPGWLNQYGGSVCATCVPSWDAVCETCDASLSEEWAEDGPCFTEADAKRWESDHECQPAVRLIGPRRRDEFLPPAYPDQTCLFDIKDAAA